MTRKDYEIIARAIWRANKPDPIADKWEVVPIDRDYLLDALQQDNPRFNRERFLTACGL